MPEDHTGEIIRLLHELIDLVKAKHPTVENHTHHHYPTNPTYNYPWTHTYGTGAATTGTAAPGSTVTWSTNDTNSDTDTPPK